MPRSSGTYALPSGQPVVVGTTISDSVFNTLTTDIANELTNSIPRDGTAPPTANLPMGNFKITGLANGTLATDAVAFGQIVTTATGITNTPAGNIAATNVQTALNELDTEKADLTALAASTGSSLVGHTASGTGAVATTVQSKLRESVSVKDFGAVGDGVTNDSPAFILAAAAANVIIVPYSSASYKLDSSVTASGKHFIIYGTLSGAGVLLQNSSTQFATNNFKIGNASLFGYTDNASAMQCYANTGATAPTGIVPSFRNVVASKGDNTTFIGAQAGYFEARDRADVTGANKGVLYALSLSVVPSVARNNVPFDDVDGLTISNTTGTVGAKATDAVYVSNNTTAFGNKSTGTSEWYSIFTADCNADVGLAFNGKLLNYGIDLRLANISSSAAIAIPNATYLYSRNASNSADAQLIGLDTNNIIALGGSASAGISVKNWLGTTAPSVVSTGTYSVGLNDNNLIFTAACTVTLPNAGSFNGRILNVKGTTANAIISASSNVVGLTGTTSTAILAATAGKWAVLISDGANWQIMSAN